MSREFTEQHVRALCLLAGIVPRSIFQVENQYWPDAYVEERKRSPWFVVTTPAGAVRMGWRKRVLSISWSDTPVRAVITADDTTKDEEMVHAWTYPKAVEYLQALALKLYANGVVGINGLTEAETSATASVMGIVGMKGALKENGNGR